jgi:hypothetical protein
MTTISDLAVARNSSGDHFDYLLAELRCAALRARLMVSDIEAISIALKAGLISPEHALEYLDDCDLLRLVGVPSPETAQ